RVIPFRQRLSPGTLTAWREASFAASLLSQLATLTNEPLRQMAATTLAARMAYRVDPAVPVGAAFAAAGTLTAFMGMGGWSRHFFRRAHANARRTGHGLGRVYLAEIFVTAVKGCD